MIDVLNRLIASRYFTGGFLAALLWDHLTTLDREVYLIWNSRGRLRWMLRSAFFLLGMGSRQSPVEYEHPLQICRSYLITLTIYGTIAVEISQCTFTLIILTSYIDTDILLLNKVVFLLRVYVLTGKRRVTLYWLTAAFLIEVSLSETFAILTVLDFEKGLVPVTVQPKVNLCITQKSRYSVGVFAPMCAFDVFIIILTIYDGFARPRQRNSEVIAGLYRDGAKFFLVCFSILLSNSI
ncbi:hypothetical protein BDQ17DRAFT_1385719, partial [Cyathus striatus]